MRIVTIERFGRIERNSEDQNGFAYSGDAYLLRFTIRSPDHFFGAELDHLCWEVLEIDPRQIMEMTLYGYGRGLDDARLLISFEKAPTEENLLRLREVVPYANERGAPDCQLEGLFRDFLRAAKPRLKRRIRHALDEEFHHAR